MSQTIKDLSKGLPIEPIPELKTRNDRVSHAPIRYADLTHEEKQLAVRNALRYFPQKYHSILAKEFAQELDQFGHIYMYRFIPDFEIKAYPINEYPAKCVEGAAIMLMIMNNLDERVAQFPHELITYGGNGQVFSNWAQFWITMKYLSNMETDQTLVVNSGHPLGLYPSFSWSPRLVISNGMVVPNYSKREDYDRFFALGVSMYGQMTAGSYCYIGPQGIVHGTTITIINAGRKYLQTNDLRGTVFLTSGLGGMSGAQAKAAVIAGCVGVIAEVCEDALLKRQAQGWLNEIISDLDTLIKTIRLAKSNKIATSIGYLGNIVDVWERLVKEYEKTNEILVELGSDQTSCHNPFNGGYYPVDLTVEEAQTMMKNDNKKFKQFCQQSLIRQINAINRLSQSGLYFWDYGNAFLLEAYRAGADVGAVNTAFGIQFRYSSYVQHIMGDIFSLGFGPFRWICSSGDPQDLDTTDNIALNVLKELSERDGLPKHIKDHYFDNIKWISEAKQHNLVVGSQARILYSDQIGRVSIGLAFNEAIKNKIIKSPIILSRDHHDVSGADSPYRETSNIYDGSAFTADMAITTVIGNSGRGATWVALHNGGGVGFGEAINCGFGLILDGSQESHNKVLNILSWDVLNGVSRRSWSGNQLAKETIKDIMQNNSKLCVTIANEVADDIISDL
ncbi:urocanate hydratase-like [Oppia nitens]|uniref:urocanate hydratase-like n=1 Tax=Oppia nitens TaxID=1686743 RepID=UPI0023DCC89B|nr:urocanate hydratase-like [Oppia nitens]